MFIGSLTATTTAMLQIMLLGACGYVLARNNTMSKENVRFLTFVLINILLPSFMFAKVVGSFRFGEFAFWWVFPLLSFVITAVGFLAGLSFVSFDKRLREHKREFISLVAFQNSGYLPMILIAILSSGWARDRLLIYLFLFLLGFNFVIWSVGALYLTHKPKATGTLWTFFSPPVIAMLVSLLIVACGLPRFIPKFIVNTADMLGQSTLPMGMIVIGANLAHVNVRIKDNRAYIIGLIAAKLIFLPLLFLGGILLFRPAHEVAFLLILEAAVPSATSLSIIMRHYEQEDRLISVGVLWTHLASLITIPFFLTLFNLLTQIVYYR